MSEYPTITGGKSSGAKDQLKRKLGVGTVNTVGFSAGPPGRHRDIWSGDIELPAFDSLLASPGKSAYTLTSFEPIEWLRLQMATAEVDYADLGRVETWLGTALSDTERVTKFVRFIEDEPGTLPTPFLLFGQGGGLAGWQEGRTRGIAAYYAGIDRMPAYTILDWSRQGYTGVLSPSSRRVMRSYLDSNKPEGF